MKESEKQKNKDIFDSVRQHIEYLEEKNAILDELWAEFGPYDRTDSKRLHDTDAWRKLKNLENFDDSE